VSEFDVADLLAVLEEDPSPESVFCPVAEVVGERGLDLLVCADPA
jgi:hypothetical protein